LKRFITSLLALLLVIPQSASANYVEPAYQAINISHAWNLGYKGAGATVAIIDQGVNLDHPYFQGQIVEATALLSQPLHCVAQMASDSKLAFRPPRNEELEISF
jgi:subtilisin family serine protease